MSERPVVLTLNANEFAISMRDAAASATDFLDLLNRRAPHEEDKS